MTSAQRLKPVFAIDIETCRQCGGHLRAIATIGAPAVIERILEHLGRDAGSDDPAHPSHAPPTGDRSCRSPLHPGHRAATGGFELPLLPACVRRHFQYKGEDSDGRIFVQCHSVLRLAILFDKVIVIRQLGKIMIYKSTQLFKLSL